MIDYIWRLSEAGPDNLGLALSNSGLLLGRTPLIEHRDGRFVVRERDEIERLLQRGHRYIGEADQLMPGLAVVARALNDNDQCLARIAAVHLKLPELPGCIAREAMEAEDRLIKYANAEWDPEKHPRAGTPPNPGWFAPTGGDGEDELRVRVAETDDPTRRSDAAPTAAGSTAANGGADADEAKGPMSVDQTLERKYDDLGPVDFSKQVIQFGDWLGRQGGSLSPADRENALAEYSFLQDRLSFWLAYDYKPPQAQANLLSAALTLFQGAVNGGIVHVGDLPQSMVDVGGAAWAVDNIPPRLSPSIGPSVEDLPAAPVALPKEIEGLGGIVDNSEAKIDWTKGIKDQGSGWEEYVSKETPDATELAANAKTFDHFDQTTGEAISDKTLNTLSVSCIKDPRRIYGQLADYVDEIIDYEPRVDSDITPAEIQSKTLQLAIPEYTSPTQWRYLLRAIIYGKDNGVSIVITRIRE